MFDTEKNVLVFPSTKQLKLLMVTTMLDVMLGILIIMEDCHTDLG